MTIEKQDTIAETMRVFMRTGPSTATYPTYKALNDAVGKVHGLPEGKCQALAGEKAWAWHADKVTGRWRKATAEETEAKRAAAAKKNTGGTRKAKVLSDADRAALDAQVAALEGIGNPALAPLLADLKARQAADDAARKGSLKDRLAACVERLGLATAVELLEWTITEYTKHKAETATEDGEPEPENGEPEPENGEPEPENGEPEDGEPENGEPEPENV